MSHKEQELKSCEDQNCNPLKEEGERKVRDEKERKRNPSGKKALIGRGDWKSEKKAWNDEKHLICIF